nr:hypothetical protein [Desulfobacteraceae bacterium]
RVFYGEVTNPKNLKLPDLSLREFGYLAPLLVFIFWIGLYPNFFLDKMHSSVDHFIGQVKMDNGADVAQLYHCGSGSAEKYKIYGSRQ